MNRRDGILLASSSHCHGELPDLTAESGRYLLFIGFETIRQSNLSELIGD